MAIMIKLHASPDYHRNIATRWQEAGAKQAAHARASMDKRHWRAAADQQQIAAYSYEVARRHCWPYCERSAPMTNKQLAAIYQQLAAEHYEMARELMAVRLFKRAIVHQWHGSRHSSIARSHLLLTLDEAK